jgi:CubicO group peptidase (beta-lactamase class C family)
MAWTVPFYLAHYLYVIQTFKMKVKIRIGFFLAIFFLPFKPAIAQSEDYARKKAEAIKAVSPFELIATHQKTDVIIEYEDDELIVFEPNRKQAPVHLLIVPKKRINTLNEVENAHQQTLGKMILLAKEIAKKKGIDQTGYRIGLNTNEDAGQSVFHIHLHLLGGMKLGPMMDQTFVVDNNRVPEVKQPILEKYIHHFKDTANFHGTVLVAKGDSIIHHAAYGFFDVENKIPNTINTQFLIGSLTKSFVATCIMQLVDKKLVDLNEPIQKYLPKLKPAVAKGVTVHHLLKQQSGLAVYLDDLTTVEVMDISPEEILDIINTSKKSFASGEKHEYSNINYSLLAMIVEQASGLSYQDYLTQNVFTPNGMTHSGVERLIHVPANRAIGYRDINGKFRRVQNVVSYAFGSGDIYSTTLDLFKWGQAVQSGSLISEASRAKMWDGGPKDWGYYGYGFRVQPYQRNPLETQPGVLIRHGGTMNGFISNYHYYKEDDLTVIILSNYRNIPIRTMSYHLKELLLGSEPGKRRNLLSE